MGFYQLSDIDSPTRAVFLNNPFWLRIAILCCERANWSVEQNQKGLAQRQLYISRKEFNKKTFRPKCTENELRTAIQKCIQYKIITKVEPGELVHIVDKRSGFKANIYRFLDNDLINKHFEAETQKVIQKKGRHVSPHKQTVRKRDTKELSEEQLNEFHHMKAEFHHMVAAKVLS